MPPDSVPPESQAAVWLAEEWGRQVTRAVESMTGEPTRITFAARRLAPAEVDPSQQELLWWEQPLSLGPDARIWVAASGGSWQEIGNRVLRSAGVDDATPEDIRSTYLEIVNQSLSGVASAVSTRARKEISCLEGRSAAPPAVFPGASAFAFEISLGEQGFPLLAVFAPSITNLSDAPEQPQPKTAPEDRAPAAGPAAKAVAGSIDLLLDVELPVIVSFGRAQLMLKDVIKLTTGSIVELNRALSEPVEVIVNNCVIARGEVVVVEGNYGIRIKQVISRQERLRTLY
ncbi:MAG: flagellar motor switch protein FliN [Bryobacteraceae bacterium]